MVLTDQRSFLSVEKGQDKLKIWLRNDDMFDICYRLSYTVCETNNPLKITTITRVSGLQCNIFMEWKATKSRMNFSKMAETIVGVKFSNRLSTYRIEKSDRIYMENHHIKFGYHLIGNNCWPEVLLINIINCS